MPCALTTGYRLGCRESVGGIKTIYFAEASTITGIGFSAGNRSTGIVTGVSFAGALVSGWYKYDMPKAGAQFTETLTGSQENGTIFYAVTLQIIMNRLKTLVRNELRLLSQGRVYAIVTDRTGTNWFLGANNQLEATAGTNGTGAAMGDRNGYDVTFSGMEEEPMFEWSGTINMASGQIIGG